MRVSELPQGTVTFLARGRLLPRRAGDRQPGRLLLLRLRPRRQIKRALAQEVLNPQAADQLWQGVDRALTDQSVIVSLNSSRTVDVVSKRVGNYQYSGNGFGVLIDRLWVR